MRTYKGYYKSNKKNISTLYIDLKQKLFSNANENEMKELKI